MIKSWKKKLQKTDTFRSISCQTVQETCDQDNKMKLKYLRTHTDYWWVDPILYTPVVHKQAGGFPLLHSQVYSENIKLLLVLEYFLSLPV